MWNINPGRLLHAQKDLERASPYKGIAVPYCIERIHQRHGYKLCIRCQIGHNTVWDGDKMTRAFCDTCLSMIQKKPEFQCSGCGEPRRLSKIGRPKPCTGCMGSRSVRRLPGQETRPMSQSAPGYVLKIFANHSQCLCDPCQRGANICFNGQKIEQIICLSCAKLLSLLPECKCVCGAPKFVRKNGYVPPLCVKCHRDSRPYGSAW
jgi:hypothetical protein